VYEGDILEKVEIPEDQRTSAPVKNVVNVKQGKGVQLFTNGDLYNGDWVNNKMHGQGGYYFTAENWFYKGDFRDGELTGRGVFFYSDS
jgi:hypothetical protein